MTRLRPLTTTLALAALLTGCLCRNPTLDLPADALEPNDTPAQATALTPGTPVVAMMNEREAPDVFRFEAVQGGTIRLDIDRLAGSYLDFDVLLEGPGGAGVTADLPAYGDPFPAALEYQVTATGPHYLTLKGDYVGPPDALCLRGTLRYRLEVTVEAGAADARPVESIPPASVLRAEPQDFRAFQAPPRSCSSVQDRHPVEHQAQG